MGANGWSLEEELQLVFTWRSSVLTNGGEEDDEGQVGITRRRPIKSGLFRRQNKCKRDEAGTDKLNFEELFTFTVPLSAHQQGTNKASLHGGKTEKVLAEQNTPETHVINSGFPPKNPPSRKSPQTFPKAASSRD
jgi:hypothetical protein